MEIVMKLEISRRQFMTGSLVAGAMMTSSGVPRMPAQAAPEGADTAPGRANLRTRPRYHRWHVDPGVDWLETNTGYASLDWSIPLSQAALVLVDVWQRHYLKDTELRGEEIIGDKLVPLLAACRDAGMKIVHAPSPPVAKVHPNWLKLVGETEMKPEYDDWPPRQFRSRSGPYQRYKRPSEPREPERQALPPHRIHPKAEPLAREPVIATGEELHRYCKQKGVLFLFFAGFNTNACILSRDYGTLKMSERGYEIILVRDCTTGMESRETQPTLSQTRGAILLLEMFGQYSVASDEVIAGLRRA
ncbi:MAG: isochorismatase family protein [Acidobacteria bacterium]|nr:isochorismatase family protein [Acidobacteriota bacterium]MCI0719062.1 isochorismatase family protein [Acidobacteriota bacterium]